MYMYIYWNMYIYTCAFLALRDWYQAGRIATLLNHFTVAHLLNSSVNLASTFWHFHKATSNFLAVWFQFNAIWQLHESLTLASECLVIATLWFFRMWNRTRVPWQWVAFQAKQMWAEAWGMHRHGRWQYHIMTCERGTEWRASPSTQLYHAVSKSKLMTQLCKPAQS